MTLLDQRPTDAEVTEPQVLFREARKRRRRLRTIWITVVTAAVVSLASLGFEIHLFSSSSIRSVPIDAQPRWLPHTRTGATLVYAFSDFRVLNADSGASRVLPLPAPYGSSRDLGMVRIGGSLVLNRGNTAWLYPGGIKGAPTDLGPSEGVFSGPSSSEAWIWSQPCLQTTGCLNYNAPQMGTVHLIDSAGRQIGAAVALPGDGGWYPTGLAGNAGIVLSELPAYGNSEEIWNPLTDRVVRVFSNAAVIGAGGDLVVWESARYCITGCSVRVSNVKTGSDQTVRLPQGVTTTGDAAISPDDSTIAITAALGGTSRIPYPQAVALIHLRTQVAVVLAGSEQPTNPNLGPMGLTWSTNGWLFSFTVGSTSVHAWRPGESRARVLPELRLPKVTHLVNEDPTLFAL